jgi:hypothetical protein
MNRHIIFFCTMILIAGCSKNNKTNLQAINSDRFIKIEIKDQYLRDILKQYSKVYDSDGLNLKGKGVIMTRILPFKDSTKYIVNLFPNKSFFDYWLRDKEFVLYDTIGNRIVILDTKIESSFRFPAFKAASDTIINKYLMDKKRHFEIWQIEYLRIDTTVTQKVFYEDSF